MTAAVTPGSDPWSTGTVVDGMAHDSAELADGKRLEVVSYAAKKRADGGSITSRCAAGSKRALGLIYFPGRHMHQAATFGH
jgi:hypothetical protein